VALCIAPFVFNPHQFSLGDFFIDYREFLRWLSRGNTKSHANSWIGYCRLSRTRITGFKKKKLGVPSEKLSVDVPRASMKTILISELMGPFIQAVLMFTAYTFVKSLSPTPINAMLRLAIISLGPLVFNMVVLLAIFFISLFAGPMLSNCCGKFASVMAATAHTLSVLGMIGIFEFLVSQPLILSALAKG
jgi:1,3-beta-glucan synthase